LLGPQGILFCAQLFLVLAAHFHDLPAEQVKAIAQGNELMLDVIRFAVQRILNLAQA
jgi:hypothetical protein